MTFFGAAANRALGVDPAVRDLPRGELVQDIEEAGVEAPLGGQPACSRRLGIAKVQVG